MKRIIFYGIALSIIAILVTMLPLRAPRIREPRFSVVHLEINGIQIGLEQFEAIFGKVPNGNNPAIFHSLFGENSRNLMFINGRTNSQGELFDPWGTAYQIEFFQKTNFIIRSAGKDKIFGDADDIIFNSVSNNFVKP